MAARYLGETIANLPAPRRVVEHGGELIEVPFVRNLVPE